MELTWWISWSQHTNLIEDRSFDFISVCFLICSMLLLSPFIAYERLENKGLIIKEFKICIASLPPSAENYLFRTIVHPSAPKLKDPTWYLHHICQFSWRQDDDVQYAPKQEKGTEHLSRVHFVISPFASKKRETVFYNITHKPAVAHILKTLLEHDFHDVKILIIQDFIILFCWKIC